MILEYMLLFSHPVTSDTLWPHGPQHARLPCPSPSPGVCPSSCSLPQWCHPVISSSVALFSFFPQSFPASMFATDDQNTGASASPSVLPVNILGWFPLWLTDLLAVQGTLKSLTTSCQSISESLWLYLCDVAWLCLLLTNIMATTIQVTLSSWMDNSNTSLLQITASIFPPIIHSPHNSRRELLKI